MSQLIRLATLAAGNARREDRQPLNDGEFLTIYYTPEDRATIVVEHPIGTFALASEAVPVAFEGLEPWDDIRAEARAISSRAESPICRHTSDPVIAEMTNLGWLETSSAANGMLVQNMQDAARSNRASR
jgi:hypothetical protein